MYIREDLLNKLKELYDTKNFTYIGIEKNIFEKPILLFKIDDGFVMINEIGKNSFRICRAVRDVLTPNRYYSHTKKKQFLSFEETNTKLVNNIALINHSKIKEIIFPEKAFNFDSELVLIKLENNV